MHEYEIFALQIHILWVPTMYFRATMIDVDFKSTAITSASSNYVFSTAYHILCTVKKWNFKNVVQVTKITNFNVIAFHLLKKIFHSNKNPYFCSCFKCSCHNTSMMMKMYNICIQRVQSRLREGSVEIEFLNSGRV